MGLFEGAGEGGAKGAGEGGAVTSANTCTRDDVVRLQGQASIVMRYEVVRQGLRSRCA